MTDNLLLKKPTTMEIESFYMSGIELSEEAFRAFYSTSRARLELLDKQMLYLHTMLNHIDKQMIEINTKLEELDKINLPGVRIDNDEPIDSEEYARRLQGSLTDKQRKRLAEGIERLLEDNL